MYQTFPSGVKALGCELLRVFRPVRVIEHSFMTILLELVAIKQVNLINLCGNIHVHHAHYDIKFVVSSSIEHCEVVLIVTVQSKCYLHPWFPGSAMLVRISVFDILCGVKSRYHTFVILCKFP